MATKDARRTRIKSSIRKKVEGTAERPRMSVFRSNKEIYVQFIDDVAGKTLVAVGSQSKEIRESLGYGGNSDAAGKIGATIAEKALAAGIKKVKFDRGANKYHGRLAALADAAREAGLEF